MEDATTLTTKCHVLFFVACPRRLDIIIVTCGIYDLKLIIKSNH